MKRTAAVLRAAAVLLAAAGLATTAAAAGENDGRGKTGYTPQALFYPQSEGGICAISR